MAGEWGRAREEVEVVDTLEHGEAVPSPGEARTEEPTAAAPLEAARARRRRLREAMSAVETAASRPTGVADWCMVMERALAELCTALHAHVADTEAPDGLLDEIVSIAPRLAGEVAAIRREHQPLLEAADGALWELTGRPHAHLPSLRRRITGLLGRLALHRQRGADLLYEAYEVDLGSSG